MIRQFLSACVFLAGGSAVAYAVDIAHGEFYPLSQADVKTVKAGVRGASLSAQLSGLQATKASNGLVNVCGFVKKDSGSTPFIGTMDAGGRFKLILLGEDANKHARVIDLCQHGGIIL